MNVESSSTETHAKECKIDFVLKAFSLFSWTQLDFLGGWKGRKEAERLAGWKEIKNGWDVRIYAKGRNK